MSATSRLRAATPKVGRPYAAQHRDDGHRSVENVATLARAIEDPGLDGLWLPDHTHIPVRRTTPFPIGGALPEECKGMLDPLVGSAMAAAVTSTLRVGSGILLVMERDPIVTAKALATLDQQSGGRAVVGISFGWNVEEMVDHGVVARTRRARSREHVLAMRSLWEDEEAGFEGSSFASRRAGRGPSRHNGRCRC